MKVAPSVRPRVSIRKARLKPVNRKIELTPDPLQSTPDRKELYGD